MEKKHCLWPGYQTLRIGKLRSKKMVRVNFKSIIKIAEVGHYIKVSHYKDEWL